MREISQRASLTPPSPIRKLVPLADKAKRQGVKIYHLNIGQPDIPSPHRFLKAIHTYPESIVAYENSSGNEKLRQGLASYYRKHAIKVDPQHILITTGGSEAILFAILTTCDPGEECLVFEPFYANYQGFASMAGVRLKAVSTTPQSGFHLPSQEKISKALSSKTRAIVIVNPNNPTGTVYTKAELLMVDTLARRHNLFLIADETYREFVYGGVNHHSLLSLSTKPQHTILVDSFSKRYSLCGARLGCLVTYNQQILEATTKFAQARLAAPTIEQFAAVEALKTPKSYLAKVNREYQKRRDTTITALQKIPGVLVEKPAGAFYCVAKLRGIDAEAFSSWLLTDFRDRNATLMLAPAAGFYLNKGLGKDEVRIAYVLKAQDLTRAMEILNRALHAYRKLCRGPFDGVYPERSRGTQGKLLAKGVGL